MNETWLPQQNRRGCSWASGREGGGEPREKGWSVPGSLSAAEFTLVTSWKPQRLPGRLWNAGPGFAMLFGQGKEPHMAGREGKGALFHSPRRAPVSALAQQGHQSESATRPVFRGEGGTSLPSRAVCSGGRHLSVCFALYHTAQSSCTSPAAEPPGLSNCWFMQHSMTHTINKPWAYY